jgi:lipoprotein-releasing system permease protein
VYVIIVLMLIIGIVNAGSAILVVISVKRNFIGMMKAIGATNVLIRKVFLVHAGSIILKGLLIGNCIGLVAIFVQFTWNVVPLNPEIYYLNHVPVNLSVTMFLLINALSFSICLISLILPTWIISKINPIKSIKFN